MRISKMLLRRAKSGPSGKAVMNSVTKPNCSTISRYSGKSPWIGWMESSLC
jgi:hypothetical protein